MSDVDNKRLEEAMRNLNTVNTALINLEDLVADDELRERTEDLIDAIRRVRNRWNDLVEEADAQYPAEFYRAHLCCQACGWEGDYCVCKVRGEPRELCPHCEQPLSWPEGGISVEPLTADEVNALIQQQEPA